MTDEQFKQLAELSQRPVDELSGYEKDFLMWGARQITKGSAGKTNRDRTSREMATRAAGMAWVVDEMIHALYAWGFTVDSDLIRRAKVVIDVLRDFDEAHKGE